VVGLSLQWRPLDFASGQPGMEQGRSPEAADRRHTGPFRHFTNMSQPSARQDRRGPRIEGRRSRLGVGPLRWRSRHCSCSGQALGGHHLGCARRGQARRGHPPGRRPTIPRCATTPRRVHHAKARTSSDGVMDTNQTVLKSANQYARQQHGASRSPLPARTRSHDAATAWHHATPVNDLEGHLAALNQLL